MNSLNAPLQVRKGSRKHGQSQSVSQHVALCGRASARPIRRNQSTCVFLCMCDAYVLVRFCERTGSSSQKLVALCEAYFAVLF